MFFERDASSAEITKALWRETPVLALRSLLEFEFVKQAFMEFLKAELSDDMFTFFLDVENLENLSGRRKAKAALTIYKMLVQASNRLLRPKHTPILLDLNKDKSSIVEYELQNTSDQDLKAVVLKLRKEAIKTFHMLARDAFIRFLDTNLCDEVMQIILQNEIDNEFLTYQKEYIEKIHSILNHQDDLYQDADDWLYKFSKIIDNYPFSISVSDMSIQGAPLIFVNQKFCTMTGYTKNEILGRNCKFLQGPKSEPESIQAMCEKLSKAENCHVTIMNYRKNGELFNNFLSLYPIIDGDGIYRFVIGIQMDIQINVELYIKLNQLQAFLMSLPKSLRGKGAHRSKLGTQSKLRRDRKRLFRQLTFSSSQIYTSAPPPTTTDSFFNTVFGFTKIIWLNDPVQTMQLMAQDPLGRYLFGYYCVLCSPIYDLYFRYCRQYEDLLSSKGKKERRMMKGATLALRDKGSRSDGWAACQLFPCSNPQLVRALQSGNETEALLENKDVLELILSHLKDTHAFALSVLATEALSHFLDSKLGLLLVLRLREREDEMSQTSSPVTASARAVSMGNARENVLSTVAKGLDSENDKYWLNMFIVVANRLVNTSVVLADMKVPDQPLVYMNDAFERLTGYGKEMIGKNCRFLQGKDTQPYLIDEILNSLQAAEPLTVKLHNYKRNGTRFENLLVLHPIFNSSTSSSDFEYSFEYCIGIQCELSLKEDVTSKLFEIERVLRHVPHTMHGDNPLDYQRVIPSHPLGDILLLPKSFLEKSSSATIPLDQTAHAAQGARGETESHFSGSSSVGSASTLTDNSFERSSRIRPARESSVLQESDHSSPSRRTGRRESNQSNTLRYMRMRDCLKGLLTNVDIQDALIAFLYSQKYDNPIDLYLNLTEIESSQTLKSSREYKHIYTLFIKNCLSELQQDLHSSGSSPLQSTDGSFAYLSELAEKTSVLVETLAAKVTMIEISNLILDVTAVTLLSYFLLSKEFHQFKKSVLEHNPTVFDELETSIEEISTDFPTDLDDWLDLFICISDSFSESIFIVDACQSHAPVVYINKEFSNITGFISCDAIGDDYSFLGRKVSENENENDAISVIQKSIRNGTRCCVLTTNVYKDGSTFENLLYMQPIKDENEITRYIVGVQIDSDLPVSEIKHKLSKILSLFRLISFPLPFPSTSKSNPHKVTSRNNQESELFPVEINPETSSNSKTSDDSDRGLGVGVPDVSPGHPEISKCDIDMTNGWNYDISVISLTKVMWLQDPVLYCRALLVDETACNIFKQFIEYHGSTLAKTQALFFDWAMEIHRYPVENQIEILRGVFSEYDRNPMYACTDIEIAVGALDSTNWQVIYQRMCIWQEQTVAFLASDLFQRFLESSLGVDLIGRVLKDRELIDGKASLRTVSHGLEIRSDSYWLDMCKIMSETLTIGFVVTDVNRAELPWLCLNTAFERISGYGKENVGSGWDLLLYNQNHLKKPFSKETPIGLELDYLNFSNLIKSGDHSVVTIYVSRKSGEQIPCLAAVYPIYGPPPEFRHLYSVTCVIRLDNEDPSFSLKVEEMSRVLRLLPQTTTGQSLPGVGQIILSLGPVLDPVNPQVHIDGDGDNDTDPYSLIDGDGRGKPPHHDMARSGGLYALAEEGESSDDLDSEESDFESNNQSSRRIKKPNTITSSSFEYSPKSQYEISSEVSTTDSSSPQRVEINPKYQRFPTEIEELGDPGFIDSSEPSNDSEAQSAGQYTVGSPLRIEPEYEALYAKYLRGRQMNTWDGNYDGEDLSNTASSNLKQSARVQLLSGDKERRKSAATTSPRNISGHNSQRPSQRQRPQSATSTRRRPSKGIEAVSRESTHLSDHPDPRPQFQIATEQLSSFDDYGDAEDVTLSLRSSMSAPLTSSSPNYSHRHSSKRYEDGNVTIGLGPPSVNGSFVPVPPQQSLMRRSGSRDASRRGSNLVPSSLTNESVVTVEPSQPKKTNARKIWK